jgi:DNA-binding CsgD family transcriptional regulator/tetratricopeptide (TPR) repeat protein
VLTGAPSARGLYREVAAAPDEPLLLCVVGVAGSGKTVLLDAMAALYAEAGARVHRDVAAVTGQLDGRSVLLVDDAQRLEEPTLHRLVELAGSGPVRLVVAQRPEPRSAAPATLTALADLLTKGRAPLVLGNLDRSGVAGRAAALVAGRPPSWLVDQVLAETGGSPMLVDRLLGALRDSGALARLDIRSDTRPEPANGIGARPANGIGAWPGTRIDLPAGLAEQLYGELERLPEPLRELCLALAVGAPVDNEVLGPLLGVPAPEVAELTERARALGLLTEGAALRPVLGAALSGRAPVRRLAAQRRLAQVQLGRGASVRTAAVGLLDTGSTGSEVAAVFSAAADEAIKDDPRLASRLLDAAMAAGAPAATLAARGAEAAARAGDLDRALELADRVLANPDEFAEADRARAVGVAAAALAQRGLLARSAELYRWLGAESLGANAMVAVPALLGTGALGEARALLESTAGTQGSAERASRPPTLLAGAESLMARGMYDTIAGSPTAALSQLARAAALLEPTGSSVLLPDTPAALAALVAAHCGELDVAQSVLDRAVVAGLGGRTAAARHRLLQAWTAMSRGATGTARGLLADVDARVADGSAPGGRLEPRDELVAAALQVGLARRAGDLAALMPAWGRAREAIVRHPVDLYVLAPLGELIVASARLREQAWVRPHLQEAHALLERLGYPVLWSASLYWAELHAAMATEQWSQAQHHTEALEAAAAHSRYADAMAVAARSWLAVLHGEVDQASVESAARGLHAVGLSWDGGKLAGQGAIRTTDRKAMSALLQCARGLQSTGTQPAGPQLNPQSQPGRHGESGPGSTGGQVSGGPADPESPTLSRPHPNGPARPERPAAPLPAEPVLPTPPDVEQGGALSDREREVAGLVVEGMTYKQIGERLFISAKTVEHHVARMRQRLGANSRGELMAHLRVIVGPR